MKIQCLICDLDGTLIPNTNFIIELFQHIFSKYLNKDFSDQDVLELWGPPERRILKIIYFFISIS